MHSLTMATIVTDMGLAAMILGCWLAVLYGNKEKR